MMPNRTCPSAMMPMTTPGILSPASSFHIPAPPGTTNAAVTTAIQKKNTRRPALRAARPDAIPLLARFPMMALPTIPAVHRTPHSGPGNHGRSSAKPGCERLDGVLGEVPQRHDHAPQQQYRRRPREVHRAPAPLHRRVDSLPPSLGVSPGPSPFAACIAHLLQIVLRVGVAVWFVLQTIIPQTSSQYKQTGRLKGRIPQALSVTNS